MRDIGLSWYCMAGVLVYYNTECDQNCHNVTLISSAKVDRITCSYVVLSSSCTGVYGLTCLCRISARIAERLIAACR